MEDKLIVAFKGGGITDIQTQCYHVDGCPTCDYGSQNTNDIMFSFVSGNSFSVRANMMYDYLFSESDIIKIVCTRPEGCDEAGFCNYFVEEAKRLAEKNPYTHAEVSCLFRGQNGKLVKQFTLRYESNLKWSVAHYWSENRRINNKEEM